MSFVKGVRSPGPDTADRFAIRDTSIEHGPDMRLYRTEELRDTALGNYRAGVPFVPAYHSQENGGNWINPPAWEPVNEDDEFETLVNELKSLGEADKLAKLRVLVIRAKDAEAQVLRQRERINTLIDESHAPITDASDERLAPIWEQAADAATEAGFCPEYDRLCQSLGIPGRKRLWRTIVEVRVNAYVYVEATSEDEAEELADARFSGYVAENVVSSGFGGEVDAITTVELADTEVREARMYN